MQKLLMLIVVDRSVELSDPLACGIRNVPRFRKKRGHLIKCKRDFKSHQYFLISSKNNGNKNNIIINTINNNNKQTQSVKNKLSGTAQYNKLMRLSRFTKERRVCVCGCAYFFCLLDTRGKSLKKFLHFHFCSVFLFSTPHHSIHCRFLYLTFYRWQNIDVKRLK